MGWIIFVSYVIVVVAAIAAWTNTKIILEEIKKIKKHLGIPEEKREWDLLNENNDEQRNQD